MHRRRFDTIRPERVLARPRVTGGAAKSEQALRFVGSMICVVGLLLRDHDRRG
jgi:hypothetical protein